MKGILTFASVFVLTLFISAATVQPTKEAPPPKKVWVCHFAGHSATPWQGGGTTLDGDYVVAYAGEDTPRPNQVDYCEVRGGNLIEIAAVAAERGHGAQLLDRIDGYPAR